MSGVSVCTVSPSPSLVVPPPPCATSSSLSSAIFTVKLCSFLSRMTFTTTVRPTGVRATKSGRSAESAMGLPSYSTITSPCLMPAASAGPSLTTSATSAPFGSESPSDSAMSGVTFWIITPSQPRVTCPFSLSCGTISFAMLIGIAKPMPMLPPLRL